MASILPSVDDCCSQCCEVNIVDLPSGTGSGVGTNFYDTIPLLRQESRVTVLVDDQPAQVYGYAARGDGGGGFFYFDGTSTAADNDASVIKPDSIAVGDPGRWLRWLG